MKAPSATASPRTTTPTIRTSLRARSRPPVVLTRQVWRHCFVRVCRHHRRMVSSRRYRGPHRWPTTSGAGRISLPCACASLSLRRDDEPGRVSGGVGRLRAAGRGARLRHSAHARSPRRAALADRGPDGGGGGHLSLIHISEPTRLGMISYAVFCLKK